ncbi:hypothetical protein V5097_06785 [Arenibacter palladensis]|uniref:hypothetical protein n=1 Tax=Arenibacter palladensis TaxID=237373 RepID=UPI002FD4B90D
MLFRLFAFIKFRLSSSNQHGVHSPFVYRFITKCLYASPHFNTSKSQNILLKTIAYFKIAQVQLVPNNFALEKETTKNIKGVSFTNTSNQLIYIDKLHRETIDEFIVANNSITNDTVVLVNGIYHTENTHKLWESIKELNRVKVTMDLFYCGLVFFRREQAKEHFKIRI